MIQFPLIKKPDLQAHLPEAFSTEGFWAVVSKLSKKGGRKIMESGLTLFFCLKDPETPKWAKSVIIGALGYLIFPMDFIPDAIIGMGFTDDWGVILGAMGTVAAHIKESHKEQATGIVNRLLRSEGSTVLEEEQKAG